MVKSKTINLICCICIAVMIVLAVVVWVLKAAEGRRNTIEMGYESLFDKSYVHTIDIEIEDWQSFIDSATGEEYVSCNVTIDGLKVKNVGLRAKGNTSLSSVASQGSEKYSFKIEFDHFDDATSYMGLDKLSLNNLIYDATMMKDYLAYTLMGEMDVPSPLCSYVEISVNGESWGLYLAVEGVENSFMQRNNMTRGELYKPDSMSFGGGRGNGRDFDFEQFRVSDDDSTAAEEQTSSFPQGGMSFPGGDFSSFGGQGFPGGTSSSDMPGNMPGNMPSGMPSNMPSDMSAGNMPSSMPSGMNMPEGFSGMTPPTGGMGDFSSANFPSEGFSEESDGSGFNIPAFGGNFNFGMGSSDVKLQYIDDDPDSYSNIFDNAKTKVSRTDKLRLIESLKKLSEGEDIEKVVFTDEVISYLAVHDFLQNSDSYTGMMIHNYYLYEEDGQLSIIPWDYNLAFGGMNGSDGTSLVNSPIDTPVTNGSTSDRPLINWIFQDQESLDKYHETYSSFVAKCIESGWLEQEISRVSAMIRPYVESDKNSFYSVEQFDEAIDSLQAYCILRGESIRGQLEGTIPSTSAGQRTAKTSLVDGSSVNVSAMGSMGGGGGGFGRERSESSEEMSNPFSFGGRSRSKESSGESSKTSPQPEGQTESTRRERPEGMNMPEGFSPPGFTGSQGASKAAYVELAICVAVLFAAIAVAMAVRRRNE